MTNDISHISGVAQNKTSNVNTSRMTLQEAFDYYTEKLNEVYVLEKRYSEQRKVLALMLNSDKSDGYYGYDKT